MIHPKAPSPSSIIAIVLSGILSSACAMDWEGSEDVYPGNVTSRFQHVEEQGSGSGGCPPDECGLNGTVLALPGLENLGLSGIASGSPNKHGVAIAFLQSPWGSHLELDVVHGKLVGREPHSGAIVLQGTRLANSRIVLIEPGDVTSYLYIEQVASIGFMSDEPGSIPVYHMSHAQEPEGQLQPLCSDGVIARAGNETVDPATLRMETHPGSRFLTLACASHMLGKAERMSYDPERASDDPYRTSAGQRQATLRMLRADYCGTGYPFTVPNVPLYWQNHAGWMTHGAPPESYMSLDAGHVEAAWDEHGALCLDTPRLPTHSRAEVEQVCGRVLPRCTEDIANTAEWISWIP